MATPTTQKPSDQKFQKPGTSVGDKKNFNTDKSADRDFNKDSQLNKPARDTDLDQDADLDSDDTKI